MSNSSEQPQANNSDEKRFWTDFIVNISGDEREYVLNTKALTKLNDADRQRAEAVLLKHLPDWRAIEGLGTIRSNQAIGPLQALELTAQGLELIRIELMLNQIGAESQSAVQRIVALLAQPVSTTGHTAKSEPYYVRMKAATTLREFPSLATSQALLQAIANDPEYYVREIALESLLLIHGYSWPDMRQQKKRLGLALGPGNFFGGTKKAEIMHDIETLIASRDIGPIAKPLWL